MVVYPFIAGHHQSQLKLACNMTTAPFYGQFRWQFTHFSNSAGNFSCLALVHSSIESLREIRHSAAYFVRVQAKVAQVQIC